MKIRSFAIAVIMTLFAVAPLSANEIYKWTDENGNVHFGDRPDGLAPDQTAERLQVASRATDRSAVQAQNVERAEARATRAEARTTAKAEAATEAEKMRAEAEERSKKCETSKARMQKMVTSRRIYRQDEAGERVYLDEAQMLAARQQVENQVREFCGS